MTKTYTDKTEWRLPPCTESLTWDGNCPSCVGLVAHIAKQERELEELLREAEALRKVEAAARARFKEWTRETYTALDDALAELDKVRGGK